jgi:Ca-activated chloride channel homolog
MKASRKFKPILPGIVNSFFSGQKQFKSITIVVLSFFIIVFHGNFISAQTGGITGIVSDNFTSEKVPFANVILYDFSDKQIAGTNTNLNGVYFFDGINAGKYKLKCSFVGYENFETSNIEIFADSIVQKNIGMEASSEVLEDVVVVNASGINRKGRTRGSRSYKSVYLPYQDYSTEDYDEINDNRFLSPVYNPLSTFSIDVDMASYSNVRRFLNKGQLPPADAVRTEELINYFTYDYAAPKPGTPVEINTEVASCPWNQQHQLALIGIQAEKIETADLPPSNLVFLLDVSGSMSDDNKLPLLKKSMKLLVNNLGENDKVSIVVYAGAAGIVLKPTNGNNKEKILQAIENLSAGGSTAGGQGIQLAYETAEKQFITNGNNRVILATDGDFNVGISDDKELIKLIEKERESGIYLTVLGFGEGNLKDSKMEKLADHGNGNYAYIDNLLEAQKTLVTEMGATLLTVAKDVKIQVEFNPEKVQAYRLIGYENRLMESEDFNNDLKDAGEIGSGKSVTALYEIIPAGITSDFEIGSIDSLKYQRVKIKDKTEFSDELMTVKVRYKNPKESKSLLIVKAVKSNNSDFSEASDNLQFAASVAEFGMLLRDSEFKQESTFDQLIEISQASRGEDVEGYRSEFIRLVKLANQIQLSTLQSNLRD